MAPSWNTAENDFGFVGCHFLRVGAAALQVGQQSIRDIDFGEFPAVMLD